MAKKPAAPKKTSELSYRDSTLSVSSRCPYEEQWGPAIGLRQA